MDAASKKTVKLSNYNLIVKDGKAFLQEYTKNGQ